MYTNRVLYECKLTNSVRRRLRMEKMTIKQIRVGLNMTQKQMAKYLGISPVSYTNKEIGKRRFYFDEVKRICELAKISIDVVKIEVAKINLESSRPNVNEVMSKVGYSDPKAFRVTFKKITGLSPVEYRNKYVKSL